jgi:hypothetical protein
MLNAVRAEEKNKAGTIPLLVGLTSIVVGL